MKKDKRYFNYKKQKTILIKKELERLVLRNLKGKVYIFTSSMSKDYINNKLDKLFGW